ncbi:esterase FE4 isoform X2 [Planococcus citri]|uniref:esterase FE4 isoform X2 n=1 Tax=Planococcus citri TaxID=170843 RepID=UPI0031F9A400
MKITLKQGELIGREESSFPSGKKFYSYCGIPYAEPPVNLLRFQDAKPHKGWEGVLEATKYGEACPQKTPYVNPLPFGDEDCLYINVHVPQSEDDKPKPVMVYIHGGGFLCGSGDFYGPDFLMEYDVIVVTFNYRLHVFGFLNLGLPECPGNMGLKDQVLAFKWVRENISAFGGDPGSITAVGESAGAACVHYLMLSPMGKGLFNRAILQSGSALSPWTCTSKQIDHAFQLGKILGCETDDKRELLNFLMEVSPEDLGKAARKLTGQVLQSSILELAFSPSVENSNLPLVFLPAHPSTLQCVHNIPILTGINDLESLIFVTDISMEKLTSIRHNDSIVPLEIKSTRANVEEILKEIEKFYFKDKDEDENVLPEIVDLLTDLQFSYPFDKTYSNMMENDSKTPIFLYQFSYEGALNIHKMLIRRLFVEFDFKGASHSDELSYLFKLRLMYPGLQYDEELQMINTMCTWWSNFIKYGAPTRPDDALQWHPTSLENQRYLHIDEKIEMKSGRVNETRMLFWNSLSQKARLRKKCRNGCT